MGNALSEEYSDNEPWFVFLPGVSCVAISGLLHCIRLTHPFDYSEHCKRANVVWTVRGLLILVMIGMLFLWKVIHHGFILTVFTASFVVQVLVDVESEQTFEKDLNSKTKEQSVFGFGSGAKFKGGGHKQAKNGYREPDHAVDQFHGSANSEGQHRDKLAAPKLHHGQNSFIGTF